MTNRNKAKGDRAERAARDWYRANGWHGAERTRAGYQRDAGDLHLLGDLLAVASVKDCQTVRWRAWLADLADQKLTALAAVAWLVVKRPGMGDPGEWLAVMTVADHHELLRQAGYCPAAPEKHDQSWLEMEAR